MKSLLPFWPTFFVWLSTTLLTLTTVFIFQAYRGNQSQKIIKNNIVPQRTARYQTYASYPKVLGETSFNITSEDAIPSLVKNYLTKYNSPMLKASDDLVEISRSYGIDPLLLVAIAQCESNLGRKMPPDCYNPFGWGIHSKGTLCFESWQEGFKKVCEGLRKKYINQGLHSPWEIMTKYNYASWKEREGSWAKCVDHFLEEIKYSVE